MRTWGKLDLTKIRHPWERIVVLGSVAANAAIVAGAVALVYLAPHLLSGRGTLTALVQRIRVAAVAVIILLPFLSFLRLGRWAVFRENSVRLGRDQVPELFAILERQCRVLGVDPPELHASTVESVGLSTGLALARERRIIVLGPNLFAGLDKIRDRTGALAFVLAHELGRLALGHAGWWEDVVLGYLKRIPVLRGPLLSVQTASRDRFAMTIAPEGFKGFVLLAVGGDLLDHVDPLRFIRDVMRDDTPTLWALVGLLGREGPHLAWRVRDLVRAGFLELEHPLVDAPPDAADPGARARSATSPPPRAPPPHPP